MDTQQTYWLEELKQNDKKLERLDAIAMELIKFYFLTLFSITTVVFTLYNYKILNQKWFFLIFFFPFILGLAVFKTLTKIVSQYATVETNRNQISEWFTLGEVKNKFTLSGTIFSAFYTLLGWLVASNFFICLYFAFPFLRNGTKGLFSFATIIIVIVAVMGILSSVVLASLNSARQKGRDAARKAHISNLRAILELYYDKRNSYPITNSFNDLMRILKPLINVPMNDPLSQEGRSYEYNSEDGKTYELKAKLENGDEFVVNTGDIQ